MSRLLLSERHLNRDKIGNAADRWIFRLQGVTEGESNVDELCQELSQTSLSAINPVTYQAPDSLLNTTEPGLLNHGLRELSIKDRTFMNAAHTVNQKLGSPFNAPDASYTLKEDSIADLTNRRLKDGLLNDTIVRSNDKLLDDSNPDYNEASNELTDEERFVISRHVPVNTDSNTADSRRLILGVNSAEMPDTPTPLCLAAQRGHRTIVCLLLEQRHDPNSRCKIDDSFNVTPLHLAIVNGHADIVKELLKAGADPKAEMSNGNVDGITTLHLAVQSGCVEIIDVLLGCSDVDVNTRTRQPEIFYQESYC